MRTGSGSWKRAAILSSVAGLLCTAHAVLGDTYTVTPLTTGLNGRARGISSTGAVCGVDGGRAFAWRPSSPNASSGTETILPSLLPNFPSDAYGVNAVGFVVGYTGDNLIAQHNVPVIWSPGGSISKLPLFNGVTSGGLATGISDNGLITGRNGLFTTDASTARWNTDGTGVNLGTPSDYTDSFGWRINARGAIAGTAEGSSNGGSQVFVHSDGVFTFLPLLQGATLTTADDINDVGHVVGWSSNATKSFFYDGATVRGLANVPGDLIQVSVALGLNHRDQIVGYGNPSPNITGALIWDGPSALPRYLSSLIDPSSPGYVSAADPGWVITEAVAINDFGQIAARGLSTHGGSYRALLLTPADRVTSVGDGAVARLALTVVPNPAVGPVAVRFTMPRPGPARLQVIDLSGRRVAMLYDGLAETEAVSIPWNGQAADGRALSPGVYFLWLQTPEGIVSRRLLRAR